MRESVADKPVVMFGGKDIGQIADEYVRASETGVAHFLCPPKLCPKPLDGMDERAWYIYARGPRYGYLVDYDFIDYAVEHQRLRVLITCVMIFAWIVSVLSVTDTLMTDDGSNSFTTIGSTVAILAALYVSSLWLFYLPIRRRLRGRPRVLFPSHLTQKIGEMESAIAIRRQRRAAVGKAAGSLSGFVVGLALGEFGAKLAETLTEKAVESADEWQAGDL